MKRRRACSPARLDGGQAAAARHGEQTLVRCTPSTGSHGLGFVDTTNSSSSLCGNDDVAVQQEAQLRDSARAGAHLGHGGGGEAFGQEGQQMSLLEGRHVLCRAAAM